MILIKQSPKDDPSMNIKGRYRVITNGSFYSATVSCPSCGHHNALINHEIATDGVVSPDFECSFYCNYKDKIKLEDWSPITPYVG